MNQTKSNISTSHPKCQHLRLLFQQYFADILILQIYYTFTALVIVTSNCLLLYRLLRKRRKTRADKMFIIVSFSDICVGLLSVPTIFLTLFTQNLDVLCMIFSIMKFFLYLPYGFSWFMIIIITIDRVLLITKGHIYKTHITMKVIYSITVFSILFNVAVATLVAMEAKSSKEFPLWVTYCPLIVEISFTIITVVAYVYLLWFVRSKSKVIANARYRRTNFDTKFVMTVTYI